MPEMLKLEDMPSVLVEYHVEPFREGYVPGSKLLAREWSSDGYDIFFHIPTPVARNMDQHEIDELKGRVRGWWRGRTNEARVTGNGSV